MNERNVEGHTKNFNALIAVMELHKPFEMFDKTYMCPGCGRDPEFNEFVNSWPCPTIQAIQEQVK